MGAGGHQQPLLTLSASRSQCIPTPIQLFGQHALGSDQLQGAVCLHLQVRDDARARHPLCHLLSPPAAPKGWWVPLEALAAAGVVLGAALLSSLRSDMVSVLGSYYYDDGCEPCGTDTFSREPFIVKFSSPTTREQRQHWGLPGSGTGYPLHGVEPRAVPARWGGCTLEPSSGTPLGSFTAVGPSPTPGCPGVLGTCPAWTALPAVSHHVPFPTISHLSLPVISHRALSSCMAYHVSSCFPLCPTSPHLLPTICFLQFHLISHHMPSPIMYHLPSRAIPHHVPSPITCHVSSPPISHLVPSLPHAITSTSREAPQGTHTLLLLSHPCLLPKTMAAWKN